MKNRRKILMWFYIIFSLVSLVQVMGCETEEGEEREHHERFEHRDEGRRDYLR